MADAPSDKDKTTEPPAPEVLKPQDDGEAQAAEPSASAASSAAPTPGKRPHRGSYRPSHKATFIGLAVVVIILAVNAGIIAFVLKSQSKKDDVSKGQVTVSQAALDKLGVNRSPVGDSGIALTVNPNARFNGNLQVGGDVTIAGKLQLNGEFSAANATFTKLQAGDTSLAKLNVNGDGTISSLALRKDLTVAGTTRLQGATTFSQLVTVNNNLNVAGSLSVGGALAVGAFQVGNLTLTGHVISVGSAPSITAGPGVGSNGTVSISGNDMAGSVAVNTGVGATGGIVANITFRSAYGTTPHVLITPIGVGLIVYVNRSATGFSIGVNGSLPPGGYAFDYLVEQ
jgi:hypothetical protein